MMYQGSSECYIKKSMDSYIDFTCTDNKPVLSVHMFIDSSIIPIDFPHDIVLSHAVRIDLCCWSLTADSHCLDWPGHVIQDSVQSEICQKGQ